MSINHVSDLLTPESKAFAKQYLLRINAGAPSQTLIEAVDRDGVTQLAMLAPFMVGSHNRHFQGFLAAAWGMGLTFFRFTRDTFHLKSMDEVHAAFSKTPGFSASTEAMVVMGVDARDPQRPRIMAHSMDYRSTEDVIEWTGESTHPVPANSDFIFYGVFTDEAFNQISAAARDQAQSLEHFSLGDYSSPTAALFTLMASMGETSQYEFIVMGPEPDEQIVRGMIHPKTLFHRFQDGRARYWVQTYMNNSGPQNANPQNYIKKNDATARLVEKFLIRKEG